MTRGASTYSITQYFTVTDIVKIYIQNLVCITCVAGILELKGQYHHDQSRLSTGHGIGVLV